jgi:hypothetical protein
VVEHFLGKEEVVSSILINGSVKVNRLIDSLLTGDLRMVKSKGDKLKLQCC